MRSDGPARDMRNAIEAPSRMGGATVRAGIAHSLFCHQVPARPHLRQRLRGVDARCTGQRPLRVGWTLSPFERLHCYDMPALLTVTRNASQIKSGHSLSHIEAMLGL